MNLNDLYNEVSRRTDTKGTKINVAETKRVLASLFSVLAELCPRQAFSLLSKGLSLARRKQKR